MGCCGKLLQHHALDCDSWLEYLPTWLFVWLLAWSGRSGLPQRDLQHCRLRERSLLCLLAGLQPRVTLRARERLCWVEQARSVWGPATSFCDHTFSYFPNLPFSPCSQWQTL